MFFSHMPELVALFAVALIVFGPKRIPEIGASVGKGIRDFKRGLNDITDSAAHPVPVPAVEETETVTR
jgi:sec-independent protein translocase protein TatA